MINQIKKIKETFKMKNMQNYTMTEALDTMMLSCEANHIRTRCCQDCEGNPFDRGSEEIYNNIFSGIENLVLEADPKASKKKIATVKEELTETYVKYKGFYDPLRVHAINAMERNFNHAVVHWIMLYVTFENFRRVARVIGRMPEDEFSAGELLKALDKEDGEKLSRKEVMVVLKTMENLGGIQETASGRYAKACVEPVYGKPNSKQNCESMDAVCELLKKAINYISLGTVIEREQALRALPMEYEVTSEDADILKGFFPLRKLFHVFC